MIKAIIHNAEAVWQHQQNRTNLFVAEGAKNPLYWFCKAYSLVTQQQLQYINENQFHYPCFVARMIIEFDKIFEDNLTAYQNGKATPSKNWGKIFKGLDGGDKNTIPLLQFARAWHSLEKCMHVHIKKDLPICLAAVIEEHYSGKTDIHLLKQDYFAMTRIFHFTAKKIESEILHEFKIPIRFVPDFLHSILLNGYINFHIIRSRKLSWQKAFVLQNAKVN
ncbi:MAG: DUF5995 family protein [Bacteroidetes bacterium]|nr:DUF5995 family protein [Bacteroidota bacterium]